MKRLLALLCALWMVWAHPMAGEGPIAGDIQFDGKDIPVAGKPLLTYMQFVSVNGVNLNLQECFCRLLAYQGQASAQTKPDLQLTFANVKGRQEGKLTFPKPGPYILVVMGRPLPGKSMPAFLLTSIVLVEPGN